MKYKCKQYSNLLICFFRGSTGDHTVIYNALTEEAFCSCIASWTGHECRHKRFLFSLLNNNGDRMIRMSDILNGQFVSYKSSLKTINILFKDSPYNNDNIYALYGSPQVGKTLLSLQESVWFESQGYNVLYVNTEGSLYGLVRSWIPKFMERFDVKEVNTIVEDLRTIRELLTYFGVDGSIVREGNRVVFRRNSFDINDRCPFAKTVEKNDINIVIVDSISAPFRDIPAEQQNYPARADAEAALMSALRAHQKKYNLGILTVHHASFNPTNPFQGPGKLRGGIVIHYNAKHVLYMDKKASVGKDIRRLWVMRSPFSKEFGAVGIVRITSRGFEDVGVNLPQYLTDNERKKLGIRRK